MKYIQLTFLFFYTGLLYCQSGDALVVSAYARPDSLEITWIPSNSDLFNKQLKDGYRLSRQSLNDDGTGKGLPEVLVEQTIPNAYAWFQEKGIDNTSIYLPIGELLYDEAFANSENSVLDANQVRYNYLCYEADLDPNVAKSLGLGYTDKTAERDKNYRYIIEALNSELSTELVIDSRTKAYYSTENDSLLRFDFEDGKSLSDMREEVNPTVKPYIGGIAKGYNDSIVIRWAPSTPELWEKALKNGYKVHKRGVKSLDVIAEVYPWSMDSVLSLPNISTDTMAQVAATIVDYDRTEINSSELDYGTQSNVFVTLFGSALLMADRSQKAAQILGLTYTDYDVEPGKLHEYYISTPSIEDPFFWGAIEVVNTPSVNESPEGLQLQPNDKMIKLVWSSSNRRHSSFLLERSTDNINFKPLTSSPLIFDNSDRNPIKEYSYPDEIENNDLKYYYRLSGMNAFGEWSEYAEVEGSGMDLTPPLAVEVNSLTYNEADSSFTIEWSDEANEIGDVESGNLLFSSEPDGLYSTIAKLNLNEENSITLPLNTVSSNRGYYFKIQSLDANQNASYTDFNVLIVPDKKIPDTPKIISATIDSFGVLDIVWSPSKADDVSGYWVYWGNYPNEELTSLNDSLVTDTTFTWITELETLNQNLYISLRSEDNVYNMSNPSEIVEVKRPDVIPPQPPYITSVDDQMDESLKISWNPSASNDVENIKIQRKLKDQVVWEDVIIVSANTSSYVDKELKGDNHYLYRLSAIDYYRNESKEYSNLVKAYVEGKRTIEVTDLTVQFKDDMNTLNWLLSSSEEADNVILKIFKSIGGNNLEFYDSVSSKLLEFIDRDVEKGVVYNYAVQVGYQNSKMGHRSKTISVLSK